MIVHLSEYLAEKLAADGFAGLAGDDCGCGVDDLVPCGEPRPDCAPAYRWECAGCDLAASDDPDLECEGAGSSAGCWRTSEQPQP